MARPIKEGLDYFPHDTDMSKDEDIQRLMFKYGIEGYGVYCLILERVFKTGGRFNMLSEIDLKFYSHEWFIDEKKLDEIISFMLELKLFKDKQFSSNGVARRLKEVNKLRRINRLKKKKAREFSPVKTLKQSLNNSETTGESKVKESKVKESKVNNKEDAKASPDFIDKLILVFTEEHDKIKGFRYLSVKGKDRGAMGKILNFYKSSNPDQTTDEAAQDMRAFFQDVLSYDYHDKYLNVVTIPKLLGSINDYKQCYAKKSVTFPQKRHDSQPTSLSTVLKNIANKK